MIYKLIRKVSLSFLIVMISVQSVFGNDFCLVSKLDDRKILISNGKDNDVNSVNRFTIF